MPDESRDAAAEFDLEDLSQVIEARARAGEARRALANEAPTFDEEDVSDALTLPIVIDEELDVVEDEVELYDSLLDVLHPVFRSTRGPYVRHRVAVLGIGEAVESVYAELRKQLEGLRHPLVDPPVAVDACYDIALFGGRPRAARVSLDDAELLGDRLATYRPNCLVLVNAGPVKRHFAARSPQQLSLLTHCINRGALVHGQRPYALVFVVDQPIPERPFEHYLRACQQLGTPAAMLQLAPDALEELVAYVRFELERYATHHLQARPAASLTQLDDI